MFMYNTFMTINIPKNTLKIGFFLLILLGISLFALIITNMMSAQQAKKSVLPDHIQMGKVTLRVQNLEEMKKFYADTLGFKTHSSTEASVILGDGTHEIMELKETPQLPKPSVREAGLYHTAILFDSRATLAQILVKVVTNYPALFQGTADHKVSEAFYFADPEGNGVELYFDKPKESWEWEDGRIVMGSEYINPLEYIETYENTDIVEDAIKVGHVHLKVGNIADARSFYVDTLGFELTADMPTALFMSKNKYHHHLGMNVWESNGADVRKQTLGLEKFEILVGTEDFEQAKKILSSEKVEYAEKEGRIELKDPWGTVVAIVEKN